VAQGTLQEDLTDARDALLRSGKDGTKPRPASAERPNSAPILVVGLPRSGTTWIGKIFDSHPLTLYLHEPDSAVPLKEMPLVADSITRSMDVAALRSALARTLEVRLVRVAGSLPRFPKAYRSSPLDWLHRRLAVLAKLRSRLFGECNLPDLISAAPRHPPRLVWKSIESVGRIGLLAHLLPELRVIHILRHPCGWIASQTRGLRESRFPTAGSDWWRFDLLERTPAAERRGLTAARLQAMDDLERDAWSWVLWNEIGAGAAETLENVTTIRYEDICAEPIARSQQLFKFAGLDWNPQTESFIRRSVSIHRGEYYSVFRDPLTAANRWREEFTATNLSVVEAILRQSAIGSLFLDPIR
jgi:hypothetical protein